MKVFHKMRAKLEPTLEEDQKKDGGRRSEALKSTLTTHFRREQAVGEGGRGASESKGKSHRTASACRGVQNPLNQLEIVHGGMSSRPNTFKRLGGNQS